MRPLVLSLLLAACGFQAVDAESTPGVDAAHRADAAAPAVPAIDAPAAVDAAQLTAASFLERVIRLECEQAFACRPHYTASSPSFAVAWGTDVDHCVFTDADYLQHPQITAAVAGGTITFDPVLAASCLAAPGIPTSCASLFNDHYHWADACFAAVLGHVADGGGCTTDWQCALGSVCRYGKCTR